MIYQKLSQKERQEKTKLDADIFYRKCRIEKLDQEIGEEEKRDARFRR